MCDTCMHLVARQCGVVAANVDYTYWERDGGGREGRKKRGEYDMKVSVWFVCNSSIFKTL